MEKKENKNTEIKEDSVNKTESQQQAEIEKAKETFRKDLMNDAEEFAKEKNINLDSVTDGNKTWEKCNKKECRERDKKLEQFGTLQNLFAGEYERRMFLLKENMRLIVQLYGADIINTLIKICGEEAKAMEDKNKSEQVTDNVANKDKKEIVFRLSEGLDCVDFAKVYDKEIKLDDIEFSYKPEADEYSFTIDGQKCVTKGSGKFKDIVYLEMFVNGELKEKKKIRSQANQINLKKDSSEQEKEKEETKAD